MAEEERIARRRRSPWVLLALLHDTEAKRNGASIILSQSDVFLSNLGCEREIHLGDYYCEIQKWN